MAEDASKRRKRQREYVARKRAEDGDAFRKKEAARQARRRELRKVEVEQCDDQLCVIM